ncbi:ATP cone domain-containing protein [Deinococcus aquiradiocola]|uniref:2-phosphoglycerate kinase n=1 Tax=Deinococcus aquiradiocola TaxID=393059 RepID=A0A917PKD7_9DEIO|nr:ATP cone domain-containing protein [Deinococcus aquiradiocola]GGJ82767.1 2-phosphoglycerate kinase [Deinococcus aquiradiocola]
MIEGELYIGNAEQHWPFSRGLVVESLLNAGANPAAAVTVARSVEQALHVSDAHYTSADELKTLMTRFSRQLLPPDVTREVERQVAAFQDIIVQTQKRELPFSRGVLARSLEDLGLAPREAYSVASQVDLWLRRDGVQRISADEIDDLTERILGEQYGNQMRLTYRFLRYNRGRLGVFTSESTLPTPFSKGILVQSLLAAGVPPDYARKVARSTQRQLRGADDRVVDRAQIREKVEELLRGEVGPEVAARYRLLRVIRKPPRPLVVLLGGVSGTGKSLLASEIAYRLGISRIVSTDSIREVMRAMVSPALIPTLHASTFNAWEALVPPEQDSPEHPSERQLLAGFREQVQQVSVGLGAVVRRSLAEGVSMVLEGVHLVPGYLPTEEFGAAIVVPLLITLPSDDEHRSHFESRALESRQQRPRTRYMKYFDEIRAMQGYLERLAEQLNVPRLDGLSLDESADRAVGLVLQRVLAELSAQERADLLGNAEASAVAARQENE